MAKATREAYGEALATLVKEDSKVVVLDADLAGSTKSVEAKKVAPDHFFDMGIAEADMIGHAAGLATSGYIPFASSFAMFCAGRAWEQIRNSLCYPNLNVKVCGSHSGITVGEDGVSHQAIEDIALMRVIPNMQVYVPCDATETKAVVNHVYKHKGPCYIRTSRSGIADVYNEEVDVTKVHVLRKGNKIAVFACGVEVPMALQAAELLSKEGIEITVIDVCAIKPCDEEGIVAILNEHETIFTAEEHNIIGGLGSLIAEISSEKCPRKIHRIGIQDRYAQSGPAMALLEEYQLDAKGLYQQIKDSL